MNAVSNYFSNVSREFGASWTRFWFTPSDPATLSLVRLLTGALVIYLHATLALDLVPLFGPNGLLPVPDIAPLEAGSPSYLNYVYSAGELWTVHLIGLAVLVLFAAGLWTRVTSVLALVVFLSDIHRAPMITGLTEPVVAMLLLYLCVAPCGTRFSLDRRFSGRRGATDLFGLPAATLSTSNTVATRLIQIHLCLWIAMMGFSKLTGDTWWNGLGVWWLIAREDSRLYDFTFLHATPKLIDVWTHAIVLFELSFPILIWPPLARPLLLVFAAFVWCSLAILTGDFTFPMAMLTASLAFVPPSLVSGFFQRSSESSGSGA
jgi:hypothetical protein